MNHDISRRGLLAAIMRLPVLLLGAYAGFFPRLVRTDQAPQLPPAGAATVFGPHQLAVLERLAWLLFPLDGLGASPYQRVAAGIASAAKGQALQLELLSKGIADLDSAAGGDFLTAGEAAQLGLLRKIESGDFFQLVYAATRNRLFDDREVWALVGYEGSSLEKGGYLNRGLSDIDWL